MTQAHLGAPEQAAQQRRHLLRAEAGAAAAAARGPAVEERADVPVPAAAYVPL
jgi:hypothetical protein